MNPFPFFRRTSIVVILTVVVVVAASFTIFPHVASGAWTTLSATAGNALGEIRVFINWQSGIPFSVKGATVTVRIADTPEEQSAGLGGIRRLSEDKGMLYVYPLASFYTHSMKGMLFPRDIIWISADKKIADVITNVAPSTYPEYQFVNDFFAQYVLEIPAGLFDKYHLALGDTVEFE